MKRKTTLQLVNGGASRRRDTSRPVMLIGFQQQGNLGIGYLAAVLRRQGYPVIVVDFEADLNEILSTARRENPMLVGFRSSSSSTCCALPISPASCAS